MQIYVIRHGEVPSNVNRTISGCNDEELTENGIKQGLLLKEKLKDIHFDAVFCSPVLRAKQTASLVVSDYEIIYDERLRERNPGTMLGHKRNELDRSEWESLEKETTIYDGDSLLAGINRVKDFFNDIEKDYKDNTILIITHMFICKSIWIIENKKSDKKEIDSFLQKNDEVLVYNHN